MILLTAARDALIVDIRFCAALFIPCIGALWLIARSDHDA